MTRATILCTVFLLAACGTSSVIERSHKFRELGQFDQAYAVLERAREDAGGGLGEEFDAAHHTAWLDYLTDRARSRIFQEHEDEALRDLAIVLAERPDDKGALWLQRRALHKKAQGIVEKGEEQLVDRNLRAALENFIAAEQIVPGFKPAIAGTQKVHDAMALLTERAQAQFLEAVRKVPEFRYVEVRWHANNVLANAPGREDAEDLRRMAQHEIAMQSVGRAKKYEKELQFGAAMMEYKSAIDLDPSMTELEVDITRMRNEMTASELVEKAQIDIQRNAFDLARQRLAAALEKSELSRATISDLVLQTRQREGQVQYDAARDLEILGKKVEALAAFESLHKDWPKGLADEEARIISLKTDIDGAAAAWSEAEAAEAAGDLQKAIDAYETSERYCAGWRDAKDRVARLRAKLAETETKPESGS